MPAASRLKSVVVPLTLLTVLACNAVRAPASGSSPAGAAGQPSASAGIPFSATPIRLAIPASLATGATAETIDLVTDQTGAPWDVAPAHLQVTFEGYQVQTSFHVPQLFVYPADEYAAQNQSANESITRVNAILANPASAANQNALPRVPFFSAGQVLAVQPRIIHFQGGSGVRFIAQYAQDISPINNGGLFYHFEGLSSDDRYYIVGVLPVNLPFLANNNNPDQTVPDGGIPFPASPAPSTSYADYYRRVSDLIGAAPGSQFNPSLDVLDAMMQSIVVVP